MTVMSLDTIGDNNLIDTYMDTTSNPLILMWTVDSIGDKNHGYKKVIIWCGCGCNRRKLFDIIVTTIDHFMWWNNYKFEILRRFSTSQFHDSSLQRNAKQIDNLPLSKTKILILLLLPQHQNVQMWSYSFVKVTPTPFILVMRRCECYCYCYCS